MISEAAVRVLAGQARRSRDTLLLWKTDSYISAVRELGQTGCLSCSFLDQENAAAQVGMATIR